MQETASGSGISWAICKSAPRSRQITTPAPHHSVFTGRMPFLPPNQQCQSTEGTFFSLITNGIFFNAICFCKLHMKVKCCHMLCNFPLIIFHFKVKLVTVTFTWPRLCRVTWDGGCDCSTKQVLHFGGKSVTKW